MKPSDPHALLTYIQEAVIQGSPGRLILSRTRGGWLGTDGTPVLKARGRVVNLNTGPVLSLTGTTKRHSYTRNIAGDEVETSLGDLLDTGFFDLLWEDPRGTWEIRQNARGTRTLLCRPPREGLTDWEGQALHDRPKERLVDPAAPWIRLLDLGDGQGTIYPRSMDKYRQIDRFVSIMDKLMPPTMEPRPWRFADMGSGKAYVTFALHAHAQRRYPSGVEAWGVEIRQDLAERCGAFAREANAQGLHFVAASIATWVPPEPLDALIALHACNTATDDAIRLGLEHEVPLLVLSPCCHQEVRAHLRVPDGSARTLAGHGILEERMAEIITDTLRSLVLEYRGYETRIFEFVTPEHSGKNLMITAVRRPGAPRDPQALDRALEVCRTWGVGQQTLLRWQLEQNNMEWPR